MDISFGYWGVITAFAGVAYTSGKLIQNHLSPELKENITLWLWGEYKNTWAAQYCQLFDFVFGQRHLSISCFFRSCLGSLFAVIFCYFLFQDGFKIFGEDARIQEEISLAKALIYGIFLNFIPDYLSLLETRWLLKQLSLVKSYIGQFLMLLLDLILTGLIISLYIIAFLYLLERMLYRL